MSALPQLTNQSASTQPAVGAQTPQLQANPDTPAHPGLPTLNRKQKAAIVVRLLLSEGAKISLTDLPESLQADLTEQISALRMVKRDTLKTVVSEFMSELENVGMAFTGGIEGALSALDGSISPTMAQRLRKEAGMRAISDPWQKITDLEEEKILPILEAESTEICAVILAKLTVAKSAALLSQIPGPRARRIAYSMSQTNSVTPDAVARIGSAIAAQVDNVSIPAFEDEPDERVGAILNFSSSSTRDDVLEGLEETDASFAQKVRKAIFTFEHIPRRMDARDIPKIIRGVEQDQLVIALAAARQMGHDASATFVLSNMSKRMAEQLEEEIGESGTIKEADGEAAMNALIAEIRTLEAAGEITLIAEDE
ncbi:flagellar motor switch protein FliG [Cochlodiniinecator piscidefendens]|uniref:flagellar motor switch protein FliG n=1 Tax=Cochlodiniinecator piscidefendens TaxID=2715756 RepID=UPI001E390CD9|nr:FliG C-terminal domain-containing protein [Cochlodiniinecator piscidefendens]